MKHRTRYVPGVRVDEMGQLVYCKRSLGIVVEVVKNDGVKKETLIKELDDWLMSHASELHSLAQLAVNSVEGIVADPIESVHDSRELSIASRKLARPFLGAMMCMTVEDGYDCFEVGMKVRKIFENASFNTAGSQPKGGAK